MSKVQRKNTIDLPKANFDPLISVQPEKEVTSFRKLFTAGTERFQARKKQMGRPKKKITLFGAPLSDLPRMPSEDIDSSLEEGVPIFVVKCLRKIETMKTFDGLYRINGDADEVVKMK